MTQALEKTEFHSYNEVFDFLEGRYPVTISDKCHGCGEYYAVVAEDEAQLRMTLFRMILGCCDKCNTEEVTLVGNNLVWKDINGQGQSDVGDSASPQTGVLPNPEVE